jgi:hypothetical protein
MGICGECEKEKFGFLIFGTMFHDPSENQKIAYTVWCVEDEEVPEISFNGVPISLPVIVDVNSFRSSNFFKWLREQEYESLEGAILFGEGEGAPNGEGCQLYPGTLGSVYGLNYCFESGEYGDYEADYNSYVSVDGNSPFLTRTMKDPDSGGWIGSKDIMPRVHEEWQTTIDEDGLCWYHNAVSRTITIYSPFGQLWSGDFSSDIHRDFGPVDYDTTPPGCKNQTNAEVLAYEVHTLLTDQVKESGRPKTPSTFINCLRSTINKANGGAYGDFILHAYLTSFAIRNDNPEGIPTYTYVTEVHAGINTYFDYIDASTKDPLTVGRHSSLESCLSTFFNAALTVSENTLDLAADICRPKEIKNFLISLYRGEKEVGS